MEKIKEYLLNPAVWISFIVFIFWLWVSYSSLNSRISAIEKEQAELELKLYKEQFESFRSEVFDVLKYVPNTKVKKFVQEHENMNLKELVNKYGKKE